MVVSQKNHITLLKKIEAPHVKWIVANLNPNIKKKNIKVTTIE